MVQNSLKGKAKTGEQIIIRQAGGGIWDEQKQQGEGLMIPHAPELVEGDHVVIFLGRNNRDLIPFVGGETGLLRVSHDAQAGDFVTTYGGLRIKSNSGDGFELGPKWKDTDWEKRRIDTAEANHRPVDSHNSISETIISLQKSKPMAKDSFLNALKESLNRHPSPEIQYEEKEAGAIVIKARH